MLHVCCSSSPHLILHRSVSCEGCELSEGGDKEGQLSGWERGKVGGAEIGCQATENAGETVNFLPGNV